MDNLRTFFIFGLLIVSLLLWEAWQNDYVRPQQSEAQQSESTTSEPDASQTGQSTGDELPEMPSGEATADADELPEIETVDSAQTGADRIRVKTDVIDAEITTTGGDIRKLALLKYAEESDTPDEPVQFLNDTGDLFFVTQSGLRAEGDAPTHYEQYTAEKQSYELKNGQDSLQVPLTWESDNGVKVTKTLTFTRDSYEIDVAYEVENTSGESYTAYPYAQYNRTRPQDSSGLLYTYTGAVFSSPENEYEKIDFDDLEDRAYRRSVNTGWSAMLQHYFVAAMLPAGEEANMDLYGKSIDDSNYTAGIRYPVIQAAAGESASSSYRMFIGPKENDRLAAAAENLDLTVDFGVLTIISKPLFIVMDWFHSLTGNWGWSIVLLTILIKLAFYRLSAKSYRSMAAMRKLTPKLQNLKERYGDDKQKFNQAMMDLYRTEKINPLGGCLPILVQMPVFLAFYWVLVESIELRHAPFMLWIQDLTAIDPYFILPVLFGLTMWFQQKLNPMPQDPAQAMMMKIFPIVFTVFFAFFPSGLVLYWLVNNLLSIAQQWYITRKMDAM